MRLVSHQNSLFKLNFISGYVRMVEQLRGWNRYILQIFLVTLHKLLRLNYRFLISLCRHRNTIIMIVFPFYNRISDWVANHCRVDLIKNLFNFLFCGKLMEWHGVVWYGWVRLVRRANWMKLNEFSYLVAWRLCQRLS